LFCSALFRPVEIGPLTRLDECMNFMAKNGCLENSSAIGMRRVLDRISSNMTKEQLPDVLDGYADLFQIILQVIPFADNMIINDTQISTFTGVSGIDEHREYQSYVYIMYNYEQKVFAPLYVAHANGQLQTRFPINDAHICQDMTEFIHKWNSKSKFTKCRIYV
jgi:hypothetical protein